MKFSKKAPRKQTNEGDVSLFNRGPKTQRNKKDKHMEVIRFQFAVKARDFDASVHFYEIALGMARLTAWADAERTRIRSALAAWAQQERKVLDW